MTDWAFPAELINARLLVCIVQGYREDGRPASYPMAELPDGSFAGLTWDGWHRLRRVQDANVLVSPNVPLDQPVGLCMLCHMTLKDTHGARKRCVIYLRLSVAKDESTSIERQEHDLRIEAERRGWTIVAVIVDDGKSGRKARENAKRALDMLRKHEAEVLAVWKFDRWSRQGLSAVAELKEVLDTTPGTEAWFLMDGLNSTQGSAWPIIATVLAEMAATEAENARTRVISSNIHLSTAGRWRGGTPPYGYTSAPNPKGPGMILVPDSKRAAVVVELAAHVLKGVRVEQLCTMLNERGTPSPNGGAWFSTSMTKVLRNPALRGIAIYQARMVVDDETGLPFRPYKPILDDDVWFQVQDRLFNNGYFRQGDGDRSMHLLYDIAKCDQCGTNLTRRTTVSLACRKNGQTICPGVAVTRERLEEYVTEQFLLFAGNSPVMDEHVEEPKTGEIRALLEALSEIGKRLVETDDDDETDKLISDRKSLRAKIKELENRTPVHELVLRPTGETYGQEWERSTVEERRALLKTVIAEVRVKKGARGRKGLDDSRVNIVWKIEELNAA